MPHGIDSTLLARYFAETCSAEEKARISAWMREDPAQREYVRRMRELWEAAGGRPPRWNADVAWEKVAQRVNLPAGPVPAAPPAKQHPVPNPDSSSPGRHRRRRRGATRPPRRRRPYSKRCSPTGLSRALWYASIAVVVVVLGTLVVVELQQGFTPQEEVFFAERGQRKTVKLSDGTQVRLNADSRLRLMSGFGGEQRAVRLEGEAYFKVAPDANKPFRVHAGSAVVEVLGTVFDVRAYDEEARVEAVVEEGAVSMRSLQGSARNNAVVLRARQQGVVAEGASHVTRRKVALDQYLAWTHDRLVFKAAPFDEVAAELERWYDLTVELTVPSERVNRLHASFHDEPLDEVLNVIAGALSLKYRRDGRHVTLYPARPAAP